MISSILPALLLIGAVVFIHELGHYLAARSIGVKVEKFSVCFGPRIFAFTSVKDGWDFKLFFYRKNEEGKIAWGPIFSKFFSQSGRKGSKTEYCLSLIPLGGYVKVAGMLDESLDTKISNKSYELMSKSRPKQVWFMSAGVIMNAILAFVIFTGLTLQNGKPVPVEGAMIVGDVMEDYPASLAGIQKDDQIIAIENFEINSIQDMQNALKGKMDQPITVTYIRESETFNEVVRPKSHIDPQSGETKAILGISQAVEIVPASLYESIQTGYERTVFGFSLVTLSIKMLASGEASLKELGGPLMIGGLAAETAKQGWSPYLSLMALISCNLAFLNILPIPGLDGGHIFITTIEGIIRRPLSLKLRMAIQQFGMVLLLMLMATVMINDIGRLFGG